MAKKLYEDYHKLYAYTARAAEFCSKQNMTLKKAYRYLQQTIMNEYPRFIQPNSTYEMYADVSIDTYTNMSWLAPGTGIIIISINNPYGFVSNNRIYSFPIGDE